MEIFASIRSQIKTLKDRIKALDSKKSKAGEIESLLKDLSAMEERYEKERAKRKEKQQAKEEAAKPAETSTEEISKEAITMTDTVEKDPKIAPHIITPDVIKEKEKAVEKVEKDPKIAPHIVSEKEDEAELYKFGVDDLVEPVRGEPGSKGRVMRHDSPKDLAYIMWHEGPMARREQFGGYYPQDIRKVADEPKKEQNPCPCWDDKSVFCPECKTQKTSDLKDNYYELLKDLKDERQEAYDKSDHVWVRRLDFKIKELEDKIKEKYEDNEKKSEHNDFPSASEKLNVIDQTPSGDKAGIQPEGLDGRSEYQDELAMPSGSNRNLNATSKFCPKCKETTSHKRNSAGTGWECDKCNKPVAKAADKKEDCPYCGSSWYKPEENWCPTCIRHPKQKVAKKQYNIVNKNNQKVMSVTSEKELTTEQLSQIYQIESRKQKTAILKEPIAFLKKGTRVVILEEEFEK